MTRIRVLCYNMRAFRDDVWALVDVVRAIKPDVVFVQETPRFIQWRSRSSSIAAACGLVTVIGGAPACGNMLMTRVALAMKNPRSLRFPLTPGEQPRAAAVAEFSVRGARFTAAGVHLGHTQSERVQHAQHLLDNLAGGPPLLLAGDFNEDFNKPVAAPLYNVLTAQLHDAAGEDHRPTFSAQNPRRRIDAFFTAPNIDMLDYDVIENDLTSRASDHLPIVADLSVLSDRGC